VPRGGSEIGLTFMNTVCERILSHMGSVGRSWSHGSCRCLCHGTAPPALGGCLGTGASRWRVPPRGASVALLILVMAATAAAQSELDDVLQGMVHLQRGELTEARHILERALSRDSTDAFGFLQLGIAQARLGDFSSAETSFGRSCALNPQDPWSSLWLGVLALRGRHLEEAEAWFTKTLETDPFNADAHYFLGTVKHLRRDVGGAVRDLTRARDANSSDPETHYRLALAYHSLGMLASAELEYRRTLALDSRHVKALCQFGWLRYNRGEREEAMGLWDRVLRLVPGYTDASLSLSRAHNELGVELLNAGNVEGALTHWNEALRYNPSNRAAQHYLKKHGGR
jgi:Flp pilus assembly protein TadD